MFLSMASYIRVVPCNCYLNLPCPSHRFSFSYWLLLIVSLCSGRWGETGNRAWLFRFGLVFAGGLGAFSVCMARISRSPPHRLMFPCTWAGRHSAGTGTQCFPDLLSSSSIGFPCPKSQGHVTDWNVITGECSKFSVQMRQGCQPRLLLNRTQVTSCLLPAWRFVWSVSVTSRVLLAW